MLLLLIISDTETLHFNEIEEEKETSSGRGSCILDFTALHSQGRSLAISFLNRRRRTTFKFDTNIQNLFSPVKKSSAIGARVFWMTELMYKEEWLLSHETLNGWFRYKTIKHDFYRNFIPPNIIYFSLYFHTISISKLSSFYIEESKLDLENLSEIVWKFHVVTIYHLFYHAWLCVPLFSIITDSFILWQWKRAPSRFTILIWVGYFVINMRSSQWKRNKFSILAGNYYC